MADGTDEFGLVMTGVDMISAERRRQVDDEGYSVKHDQAHDSNELLDAAWCYLTAILDSKVDPSHGVREPWPWDEEAWKPTPDDPVRQLVKTGALVAAEIDRLLATKAVTA